MSPCRCSFAVVCLVLASVPCVAAQGLAGLARRTDEERGARPDSSRRYEITAEPDLALTSLTRDVVSLHARLRMDMARLWTRDRGLFQRLRAGGSQVRSLEESCRVLEHEPEVMALLESYETSPYGFFSVMVSIRQAEGLAEGFDGYRELTPLQLANRDFAGRNGAWLSAIRGQILRAEAGWSLFQ